MGRRKFEDREWRVVEWVSSGGVEWITRSRTVFQAGKQIMGEKVMSGGVPLDECEPDKISGDEAEGR